MFVRVLFRVEHSDAIAPRADPKIVIGILLDRQNIITAYRAWIAGLVFVMFELAGSRIEQIKTTAIRSDPDPVERILEDTENFVVTETCGRGAMSIVGKFVDGIPVYEVHTGIECTDPH